MISVCIATYNGEKYIKNQLHSILIQLEADDEVIISDDGSSDDTLGIISDFNDSRIRVFHHTSNHGYTKNFENALMHASGEYIFLSDQDDEWLPDKVNKMIEAMKNCDFVLSDCLTVDGNGNILDNSHIETFNIKSSFLSVMMRNRYLGCCMAFRRNVLLASLPFPDNSFYVEHDTWLASVATCYFRVRLLREPLIKYIRHGENTSDAGFGKGYSFSIKIKRRLYRLKYIIRIKDKVKKIKSGYVT